MARQRGNRWQADVVLDGKRERKSFASEAEALAYERAVASGKPLPGAITFHQFHREHFSYLWGDIKAPQAVQFNLDALDKLIPPETPIPDISSSYIIGLVNKMKASGSSNATINRRLSTLSRLLRHAEAMEMMHRPRIAYLKETEGRERVLSRDEEARAILFFEHMGLLEAKALFNFLLYTGCRLGETFTLPKDRVRDGRVTFHYTVTKTSKTRIIPLVGPAATAWADISKLHRGHERPFGGYPRDTFRNHWNRLRDHLAPGDDEFVPHMLRHTCASRLVSKGIPLPQVMLWMGHKNIQTTMRYSHLAPKDLDMAALALMEA
ncbi:tyrosine-type recombinase/integrase [Rhizobium sp. Leaf341]|uniref:tyrosine-type recombinase/integrase n=1 Tax=Rhizobium sp. Leaf341 TaxID=1736344 RepID=UPI0007152BCB|nr:site-specific integrase [Rhizobium sp. Leaf341]KQR67850.1 hypothetical protein ASG03_10040 [Rhizobium sp. Leaf341]